MTTLDRLGADDLRRVVTGFRDALKAHQEGINRLNVYPVPDGDTGTNLALTLESVAAELAGADPDLAATCKAVGYGALMGARGNSGVILSQILRGLTQTFATAGPADDPGIDGALLIPKTRSVHSIGMRFDLDVAFLDGDQRVVKVVRLNRGRVTLPVWSARSVVEAEAGSFREWGLRCGDELEVR